MEKSACELNFSPPYTESPEIDLTNRSMHADVSSIMV